MHPPPNHPCRAGVTLAYLAPDGRIRELIEYRQPTHEEMAAFLRPDTGNPNVQRLQLRGHAVPRRNSYSSLAGDDTTVRPEWRVLAVQAATEWVENWTAGPDLENMVRRRGGWKASLCVCATCARTRMAVTGWGHPPRGVEAVFMLCVCLFQAISRIMTAGRGRGRLRGTHGRGIGCAERVPMHLYAHVAPEVQGHQPQGVPACSSSSMQAPAHIAASTIHRPTHVHPQRTHMHMCVRRPVLRVAPRKHGAGAVGHGGVQHLLLAGL